jgi:uroporphyrin-III C-methyltransferase
MTVALVGAGPGSAELLTLRGARLLADADVVVYDRLVDPSVLALASADAELIDVGKRPGGSHNQALINELLVVLGRRHELVVRLKGGDPFVFGRGGEEIDALHAAGIETEVVPGITSALSGPSSAGIPVTHRGLSHGVCVVTGHARDGEGVDFRRLANDEITLVILMGIANRASIARELVEGGLADDTPVAVVERAWTVRQTTVRSTLGSLGSLDVANPAVIIVGQVAALDLSTLASLANSVR